MLCDSKFIHFSHVNGRKSVFSRFVKYKSKGRYFQVEIQNLKFKIQNVISMNFFPLSNNNNLNIEC